MSRIYHRQKRLQVYVLLLVVGLTLLIGIGLPQSLRILWHWFASYFASVNLVTWIMFYYDKRISGRKNVVRVPENVFFILAVAGGLPSMLIAMQVLRHKRAKSSFKWKLFAWFVIVYSLLGFAGWLWFTKFAR